MTGPPSAGEPAGLAGHQPAPPAAALIGEAIAARVIPGAVLAAGTGHSGPVILHAAGYARDDETGRRPMTAGTVFDLASLTKVTATLPCLLYLAGRGDVGLDHCARRYLPAFTGAGKDQVTVRQLLSHTSGLPAERRYYQQLHEPAAIRAAALAQPLAAAPGTAVCYSDIGFIVLGEIAAAVAGCGLDELAAQVVFGPLAMTATRYRPPPQWAGQIAATEATAAPAGASSPQPGTAKVGVVHDENAEALGGVAGHAGLFATAGDLARYAAAWAAGPGPGDHPLAGAAAGGDGGFWGLRGEALACQTDGLGGRRGLGWGLRGDRFDNMGDGWPPAGAGHTGFTGTSLSVDPVTGMWAVLLTNAVHYGRGPEHSVIGLRKQVHAAVAAALQGGRHSRTVTP